MYAQDTLKAGRAEKVTDTWVHLLDRRRPESHHGSFNLSRSDEHNPSKLVENIVSDKDFRDIFWYRAGVIIHEDESFLADDIDGRYAALRKKFFRLEKMHQAHFMAACKKFITALCSPNPQGTSLELPQRYGQILSFNESAALLCKSVVILLQNPEMRTNLMIDEQCSLEQATWSFLEKYLPELFAAYPDEILDSYTDSWNEKYTINAYLNIRDLIFLAKAQFCMMPIIES